MTKYTHPKTTKHSKTTTIRLTSSPTAVRAIHIASIFDQTAGSSGGAAVSHFAEWAALEAATEAINAEASQLGSLPGNALSDTQALGVGYVRYFEGCDIYYSDATGPHEVHGDIRAKYNALFGWYLGVLGLPITDETGTPDGVGRFNHFVSGSIYWTPDTGPMMVKGKIRDLWASQGWERGPLGYPVNDEYRFRTFRPNTDPLVALWTLFQNGAIVQTPDGVAVALAATVSPDGLRRVIRQKFDVEIHKSPENIGLHPNVDTIAVSNWGYDFWASRQRLVTLTLHGFHDNGLAPDTDFELTVTLLFGLTWEPSFTEPTFKTLIVGLQGQVSVSAHGLGHDTIAKGVAQAVVDAFQQPFRVTDDLPTSSPDVIGMLVTSDGGLQVLLNPLPEDAGNFRLLVAQRKINDLVG
jgi:hypothetical protein